MLNKKLIDRIFWNSYATAYDDLAKYYAPYKALISEISVFVRSKLKCGSILDAGCGTGELASQLAASGYKLDAFDISNNMLAVLRRKIIKRKLSGISVKQGDLNKKLPYKNRSFDAVINVHSLFMMDDMWKTLSELDRVLKKGGYLIIAHHKPIKIRVALGRIIKNEGLVNGLLVLLRLSRVAFFNMFLIPMHRKIYGDIKIANIVKYLKKKKMKTLLIKTLYNGFDELVILKKRN